MDKIDYALLVHDQDKPKNCTKFSGNQETKYPKTYYQFVRFLDNTNEASDIVPGLKFCDQTIFRVSFYQEIQYRE
jgi:hypothetical protein